MIRGFLINIKQFLKSLSRVVITELLILNQCFLYTLSYLQSMWLSPCWSIALAFHDDRCRIQQMVIFKKKHDTTNRPCVLYTFGIKLRTASVLVILSSLAWKARLQADAESEQRGPQHGHVDSTKPNHSKWRRRGWKHDAGLLEPRLPDCACYLRHRPTRDVGKRTYIKKAKMLDIIVQYTIYKYK